MLEIFVLQHGKKINSIFVTGKKTPKNLKVHSKMPSAESTPRVLHELFRLK